VNDSLSNEAWMPGDFVGHRWRHGSVKWNKWNLEFPDTTDGTKANSLLTFLDRHQDVLQVAFHEFGANKSSVICEPRKDH
jgi:hypothetical protein